MKFTSQLFSRAEESFKDEARLLLLCVGSLVTLNTFVFTHIASVVGPVHTFMEGSRVSKGRLKGELCFHCYVRFSCVPIYSFGFRHKQCASDQKDFTFAKFSSWWFSDADGSFRGGGRLPPPLSFFASGAVCFCARPYGIRGGWAPGHNSMQF